eukprot:g6028.t1
MYIGGEYPATEGKVYPQALTHERNRRHRATQTKSTLLGRKDSLQNKHMSDISSISGAGCILHGTCADHAHMRTRQAGSYADDREVDPCEFYCCELCCLPCGLGLAACGAAWDTCGLVGYFLCCEACNKDVTVEAIPLLQLYEAILPEEKKQGPTTQSMDTQPTSRKGRTADPDLSVAVGTGIQ